MIGWIVAGAALAAVGAYARWIEPFWLEVTRIEVPIRGLRRAFDGYRIAFLADIHWDPNKRADWLRGVVARTNALGADMIALGGDLITFRAPHVAEGIAILAGLRAPDGVWCVLGNHDYHGAGDDARRVRDELVRNGMRELWNESAPIRRGDAVFWLGGVGDLWRDACDVYGTFREVPADEPRILLCHNPDGIRQRGGVRVDLVLSGHTHGGQVRLPFVGALLTRTRAGRHMVAGMYRFGDSRVYTSRGIAHGRWQVRFLVRPELSLVILRAAEGPPQFGA